MNTYTLNQIIDLIQDFARRHLILKGSFYKTGNKDGLNQIDKLYPLLWVIPSTTNYQPGRLEYNLNILLLGKLASDRSNEIEVYSDCLQIVSDLVSYIKSTLRFNIGNSLAVTPVDDSISDDMVSGWNLALTIGTDFNYQACNLPVEVSPTAAPTPAPCTQTTFELLTNGDFENVDSNWNYVFYGGIPAMDISNGMMNLTAQGAASVDGFYQTFSLDETKTYTFSGITTRDYNGQQNTEGLNVEFWSNAGNHFLTTVIPIFADDFAPETTFSITINPSDWVAGATYLRDTYGLPNNLTGFIISSNGTYLQGFHWDNLSFSYADCI